MANLLSSIFTPAVGVLGCCLCVIEWLMAPRRGLHITKAFIMIGGHGNNNYAMVDTALRFPSAQDVTTNDPISDVKIPAS